MEPDQAIVAPKHRRWTVWLFAIVILNGLWTALRLSRHFHPQNAQPLAPNVLMVLRLAFLGWSANAIVVSLFLTRILKGAIEEWRAEGKDAEERLILILFSLMSSIGLGAFILSGSGAPQADVSVGVAVSIVGVFFWIWEFRDRFW